MTGTEGEARASGDRAKLSQRVIEIATGYVSSQVLFHADDVGVFEVLKGGPRDLASIAEELGLHPDPLERLLIGCCALGLLDRHGDRFELTEASRTCLLESSSGYVGGLFPFYRQVLYPLYQFLGDGLRDRKPQWGRLPGMGTSGPFEALYQDDSALRRFQRAMFQLSYPTALAASGSVDFSPFRRVVDIGGGTGGFLNGLCERIPHLQGTIFDLPPVESAALETAARHGHQERIRFMKGDFFKDPLPEGADLFVLGDILHDWSEEDGTRLLRKIHDRLPENGALCIHENLLRSTRDGPHLSAVINLTMLIATFGRQRTAADFESWLGDVGFRRFEHHFLSSPRDVFVAWKG